MWENKVKALTGLEKGILGNFTQCEYRVIYCGFKTDWY